MGTHNNNPQPGDIDARLQFLLQSAESHNEQIGNLTAQIAELSKTVSDLATATGALLLISQSHKARLDKIEEGNKQ
jgi:prefoldin subunit 5